jgi:hypothetical protein
MAAPAPAPAPTIPTTVPVSDPDVEKLRIRLSSTIVMLAIVVLLIAYVAALLLLKEPEKITATLGILTTFLGTAIGVLSGAHSGQAAANASAATASAANKVSQQATALLTSSQQEARGLRQQLDDTTRQYQAATKQYQDVTRDYQKGVVSLHSMVHPSERARSAKVVKDLGVPAAIGIVPFVTNVVTDFIGRLRHMDPVDVDISIGIEAEPPDGNGLSRGAYRDMCADCESRMRTEYGPTITMDDDWRTKNESGTVTDFINAAADLVH